MATKRKLPVAIAPAVAVAVAIVIIFMTGPTLATTLQLALTMAALGVSFQLVYGLLGELSLGHPALFGTGCYMFAVLATSGTSLWLSAVIAGLAATVVGAAVAAVTSRLGGAYFAVATLSLSGLGAIIVGASESLGRDEGFVGIPSLPPLFGTRPTSQLAYAFLLFAIVLVVFVLVRRSPLGRSLEVVRSSPDLARSMGIGVGTMRIIVTALAGLLAGLAGATYAQNIRYIAPDVFGMYFVVTPLAIVAIGGARSLWGTIPGAILVVVVPQLLALDPTSNQVFSAIVLLVVFVTCPNGLLPQALVWLRAIWTRLSSGRTAAVQVERVKAFVSSNDDQSWGGAVPEAAPGGVVLQAQGINVRFGAFRAVNEVSLNLRQGEVVGLIGANGAGKSTFVNAITGHVPGDAEKLVLAGKDLSRLSPTQRARAGLARTFQQPLLPRDLTVRNSLKVAQARGRLTGSRRRDTDAVDRTLDLMGLTALADEQVARLTFLDQRLLGIGMALVRQPVILILDEATAGLTSAERHWIGRAVLSIARAEDGPGVVVIEHDVPFVAEVCDRIMVMNEGKLIKEGAADQVLVDAAVIASYLGSGA